MVDFFFYLCIVILFLLLPIPISAKGSFSLDRRVLTVKIKLFGIKIASINLLLSQEGVFVSLNGKKGKEIKNKKKKKPFSFHPLSAIVIKQLKITICAGGEAGGVSLALGSIKILLYNFVSYLKTNGRLDDGKIRIKPCYTSDTTTVNFSTRFFSSFAMAASAFIHTKDGANNEE